MIQTSAQFASARHRLDLSVSQCAKVVNVEERTLRRWEAGDKPPAPSACRILQACSTDVSILRLFMQLGART